MCVLSASEQLKQPSWAHESQSGFHVDGEVSFEGTATTPETHLALGFGSLL